VDLKPTSVLLKKGWVIGAIERMMSKLVALEIERTLVSFVVTVGMEERSSGPKARYLVGTRCLIPRV